MSTSNTCQTSPKVTAEIVDAAIKRGRQLRSEAFRAMLLSIFGRPEDREAAEALDDRLGSQTGGPRLLAGAGRC